MRHFVKFLQKERKRGTENNIYCYQKVVPFRNKKKKKETERKIEKKTIHYKIKEKNYNKIFLKDILFKLMKKEKRKEKY